MAAPSKYITSLKQWCKIVSSHFWQLIELTGLSGELNTLLYRPVHQTLSAIQKNGVSAPQMDFILLEWDQSLGL